MTRRCLLVIRSFRGMAAVRFSGKPLRRSASTFRQGGTERAQRVMKRRHGADGSRFGTSREQTARLNHSLAPWIYLKKAVVDSRLKSISGMIERFCET